MRLRSVEALFEAHPPRCSLPSNLSQLGVGRRANKKPRPIIAGQGCVGSDNKLLYMRFCCRTGSTPLHPNTLSLFRYEYKDDSAASCRSRNFHDKALSVSSPDHGVQSWCASETGVNGTTPLSHRFNLNN